MAEHIDRNRLQTDLRYRFDYLSKFLNFTSDDIAMLNAFAPILFPRIPVLVDTIYRKLFSYDITKDYFSISNNNSASNEEVKFESAQITFRKDMLSMYLKRVLTQSDWNDTFLQYLSEVGKIHTNKSGSALIHVDYIHINALLGYVEHLLLDVLLNSESLDEKTRQTAVMSMNKFFWIQNDIFTMHYISTQKEDSTPTQPPITTTTSKHCCI